MKLGRSIICVLSLATLPIGASIAGEDSTDRYHGTGPEYFEGQPGQPAFRDADSNPDSYSPSYD